MPSATSVALRSSSFLPVAAIAAASARVALASRMLSTAIWPIFPLRSSRKADSNGILQLVDDPARRLKLAGDPRQLHPTVEIRQAHHADDRADGLHVVGRDQHLCALRHIRGPALGHDLAQAADPGRHRLEIGGAGQILDARREHDLAGRVQRLTDRDRIGRIFERIGAGRGRLWPRPSTWRRPPVRDLSWRVDPWMTIRVLVVLVAIGLSSLVLRARRDARIALAPTARLSADNGAHRQRDVECHCPPGDDRHDRIGYRETCAPGTRDRT